MASSTAQQSADSEEDDPIVRELDVYICNEFLGSSTHLCLFQSPLRPPWRPYEYSAIKSVRLKSNAKRLEMDMPLETHSSNYSEIIEDFKKVKQVTLRSSLVESKAPLAVATIQVCAWCSRMA
jgi:DNA-directed RNA polymerase-3 subunit RPC5